MPEVDEIKDEVMATVESELDAWESFYKKFREDYSRIAEYEKKIDKLQEEIQRRDSLLKRKLEREKGPLFAFTGAFVVVSAVFIKLISGSLNVWLYFFGGLLIGLGAFSLLYLWTR